MMFNNVNRELKVLRAKMGMSQKNFSNKVAIPYSTYVSKENGYHKFNQQDIKQIKESCELTIEEVDRIFLVNSSTKKNKHIKEVIIKVRLLSFINRKEQ